MRYCINIDIDGYTAVTIDSAEEVSEGSVVVIFLDSAADRSLTAYYRGVYTLIRKGCRIFLLIAGETPKIRKQLAMLMYSYNCNDIYQLSEDFNKESITSDYISVLEEQEPDEADISMFIGTDVTAYSRLQPLIAKAIRLSAEGDTQAVGEYITEHRDIFEKALNIFNYTKAVTEKVNMGSFQEKLTKAKESVSQAEERADEAEKRTEDVMKELETAKMSDAEHKSELQSALSRVESLEKKLNQGSLIREYITTNTKVIACKVKVILYFKEVTRINFINSFMSKYYDYITKLLKKKVKLIIYDNPHAFLGVYKPIQAISSVDYVANRQDIAEKMNKLVLIEPNPSILQDVLTGDSYDIVIVYDRLKQETDIVSGNNVYKYYVVNSMKEINEIMRKTSISMSNVITNPGVDKDALAISRIPNYKLKADSPKLSAYMNMANTGNDTRPVFDIITEAANINQI